MQSKYLLSFKDKNFYSIKKESLFYYNKSHKIKEFQFASYLHLSESARKNLHGITKSLKAIKLLQQRNANENNSLNLVVHTKHECGKYIVETHADGDFYKNELSNLSKKKKKLLQHISHYQVPITKLFLLWKYIS